MTQDWPSFLAQQGLAEDGGDFGDLAGELATARAGAVFAPLVDQGLIRVSGSDAAEFLHNLMTNDVKGLNEHYSRFSGLCSAKGRLLGLFLIWRDREDFLLMLPQEVLPAILKKLSMYVLRAKVKLSDATRDYPLVGLAGASLPQFGENLDVERFGLIAFQGGRAIRLDGTRWLIALDSATAPTFWPGLEKKARPVGLAAWNWLEIVAGRPQVVTATQEAFVPQMLNMELPAVAGVSFTKGCYPGQEIVARTQYLGKVKRRTFRARLGVDVAPGTHVFATGTGDQHCGAIVSVAPSPGGGFECLVCVQISAQEAGDVRVSSPDGERLEFLSLPYSVKDDEPAPA